MEKAREYFGIETLPLETSNNIFIGDGTERFWVKKSALEIEINPKDSYDWGEYEKEYDSWCISAKSSDIFKISASTLDGHDANQYEVHDLNARFETIEEAKSRADELQNEWGCEYVFEVIKDD